MTRDVFAAATLDDGPAWWVVGEEVHHGQRADADIQMDCGTTFARHNQVYGWAWVDSNGARPSVVARSVEYPLSTITRICDTCRERRNAT